MPGDECNIFAVGLTITTTKTRTRRFGCVLRIRRGVARGFGDMERSDKTLKEGTHRQDR